MKSQLVNLVLIATLFVGCEQQNRKSESAVTEFTNSPDGTKIAYQIYGKRDMPLVFVHGWCCEKLYWDKQIVCFKKDYMIVVIDLSGHISKPLIRYTDFLGVLFAK